MTAHNESESRLRLIGFAKDAALQIKPLSESLSLKWSKRSLEFERGIITDEDTAKWLEIHADYWQEKDRSYAGYVRKLASSYKPVIDI